MAGKLMVVATPIGNLEDITLRALRVLKECDVVAAEDTRHTGKLLAHYGIKAKCISYHEHNEAGRAVELIERIIGGETVALVSDAGTPGISDPGFRLVKRAVSSGLEVVSIPGASAVASALSVSALPIDSFTFKGFMPRTKAARRKLFCGFSGDETFIFYESPNRLLKSLVDILETLGDVQVVVARELTKLHEEVLRGTVSEVIDSFKGRSIKGEITLIIRSKEKEKTREDMIGALKDYLHTGMSVNEAAKEVSKEFGISKSNAYKEALDLKAK